MVALVHDGEGGGSQMSPQERQNLIEVRNVGAGENEAQQIVESIAGQMDLGGQAGAGSSHRLGELPARRVGTVDVNAHRGAVDHEVFVVSGRSAQPVEDRLPQSVLGPGAEPAIDAFPPPKACWQIPPGRSRAQDPKDRFDAQPLAVTPPATTLGPLKLSRWALIFLAHPSRCRSG